MGNLRIRLKHAGQTRENWVIEEETWWGGWEKWKPSKPYYFRTFKDAEHFLMNNRTVYYY